jgi:hypothetical protein
MEIFETCHAINDLLISKKENEARNELIKLLDYHETNQIGYDELVNHLIRECGLYPYLETETANWQGRYIYELFKVDIGAKEKVTLHREQSTLLKKLLNGENLAVSAPTSFGKSFVIDSYISINKPNNVFIIVPTLALTDETRRRLYKKFAKEYKIITTTEAELSEKNIFIFPQERAISYVGKLETIDILIIDEFYKASSKFDRERSPALIKAILKLGKIAKQKYFLAPNISKLDSNPFTEGMEFYPLDFNTVYLEKNELFETLQAEELKSGFLLKLVEPDNAKTLIYAGTYTNIDSLSTLFIGNIQVKDRKLLNEFAEWLSLNYDYNWKLTNLVKRGVGVHNGSLHRSLSQIQIKLFEEQEGLNNIISTSSIIEGVNTSAENVVIWSNKNGIAKINDFTYKNIMGRGGRMFKHFIGKIYILASPPEEEQTQLEIPFPDEILGDLDQETFKKELTKDQIAKIILYKEEMGQLLGKEVFERIQAENIFQLSDSELIKTIAYDMKNKPNEWNGLSYLNTFVPQNWERLLFKIINLNKAGWDFRFSKVVEFVKILRNNWTKSIPQLLAELEPFAIGIDDFFKLERKVTFKLSSLLNDINILQKEILTDKKYDILRFISWTANAFLPPVVFELEEFGLPRMISKKIQNSQLINFYADGINIYSALETLKQIGENRLNEIQGLMEFDKYIIAYFYDGIKTID